MGVADFRKQEDKRALHTLVKKQQFSTVFLVFKRFF